VAQEQVNQARKNSQAKYDDLIAASREVTPKEAIQSCIDKANDLADALEERYPNTKGTVKRTYS
jgi:hypothetical protein